MAVAALLLPPLVYSTPAGADEEPVGVAAFSVAGSVEQIHVTGAEPGAALLLVDERGRQVATGTTDEAGALLFRDVQAGDGYRVEQRTSAPASSPAVRVLAATHQPPRSFYESQPLGDGYGYITTRDGTLLAVNVRLPGPPEDGPYPTVVEYSGYDPANPGGTQAASQLAQTIGYATVGVNMRGTGCSGGAWDYFEPLQALDGYDAVEVVAAQPWVANGKVGMVGISYSGITQLFVAATRPPHLAAITPVSVIDDTYRGVLYPGGIFNNGFALEWAGDRQDDARPAPDGQRWAQRRIDAGDEVCRANQALRLQAPSVIDDIADNRFTTLALQRQLSPYEFVERIAVPTFLAGAWQDEQTGGHWPTMIERFSPDISLRVTMTNGTHFEPFGPAVITRWAEFLDFYVGRRVPSIPAGTRAAAPLGYIAIAGAPLELPADRFTGDTDFDAALERYEAEPPVRVLFDNGGGGAPGTPVPAFETTLPRWPAPGTEARAWYLGPNGTLATRPPTGSERGASDDYRYDPDALARTSHPSEDDDYFSAFPAYEWKPVPDGTGLAYVSEPLARDAVMLGPGSVDLWLLANADDVDLEATISEVRPDGKEMYVQSGWLRASHRRLAPGSTDLEPRHSHLRADAAPLPDGELTRVRIPLFPFGHAFRERSRIRITVQAPGGNRPRWAFDALPADSDVVVEVARSAAHPSRAVLPVISGIGVPTALPPCPSLRGQPCRDAVTPQPVGEPQGRE